MGLHYKGGLSASPQMLDKGVSSKRTSLHYYSFNYYSKTKRLLNLRETS